MNEQDRLVAAIKGDKIAATDAKFWHLIQTLKVKSSDEHTQKMAAMKAELKRRLFKQ